MDRVSVISETIDQIDGISLNGFINETEYNSLTAEIEVELDSERYPFSMEIFKPYPFQFHNQEAIRFVNESFLDFDHVNADGSICIHTNSCPDSLAEKLKLDLTGLIAWVRKYVVERGKEEHYEHIIVPYNSHDSKIRHFLFTDVIGKFEKGQHGLCSYKLLINTELNDLKGETYLLHEFGPPVSAKCHWSGFYNDRNHNIGFYIFTDPPVSSQNGRLAAKKWPELRQLLPSDFLQAIWSEVKENKKIRNSSFIPVFFGYRVSNDKIHWQAATFSKDDLPNYSIKNPEGDWSGELHDVEINWVETFDCSYDLFFGRGKLTDHLVSKKIMIIGCGALGSLISENLVRGGALHVALVDFDRKEPGNIVRSNYKFFNGVTDKTQELGLHLMTISPFVELKLSNTLTDSIKLFKYNDPKSREILSNQLNEYDFIFDCTTDNDMLFILDDLKLQSQVISIGITNHANELILTTGTNIYRNTALIFDQLVQDTEDLFNPTGCWSPTFKASHADINALVGMALSEVDNSLSEDKDLRNFHISRTTDKLEICRY